MLTYSITRALCLTVVWPNLWVKKIFSREPWTLDLYFETLSLSYFIFQKECWGLGGSLVFCFLFQFLTLQGISSVYSTISRLGLICFKVYEISKSTVFLNIYILPGAAKYKIWNNILLLMVYLLPTEKKTPLFFNFHKTHCVPISKKLEVWALLNITSNSIIISCISLGVKWLYFRLL